MELNTGKDWSATIHSGHYATHCIDWRWFFQWFRQTWYVLVLVDSAVPLSNVRRVCFDAIRRPAWSGRCVFVRTRWFPPCPTIPTKESTSGNKIRLMNTSKTRMVPSANRGNGWPVFLPIAGILTLQMSREKYERTGLTGKPIRSGGRKHAKERFG